MRRGAVVEATLFALALVLFLAGATPWLAKEPTFTPGPRPSSGIMR